MPKIATFHSTQPNIVVYHDNAACTEGKNIEARFKAPGTCGRPRCKHCNRLAEREK
jgi:hypothetical protein